MSHVDGFVLPVPKRNVPAYRRLAQRAGKVWREHGARGYRECMADQLTVPDEHGKRGSPFPRLLRLRRGETMFFSGIPE